MQITAIILFRLILYDEPVYEDVSGSVTAYGYIESIKERDKGITVTVYNVDLKFLKEINFLYIIHHRIIL